MGAMKLNLKEIYVEYSILKPKYGERVLRPRDLEDIVNPGCNPVPMKKK